MHPRRSYVLPLILGLTLAGCGPLLEESGAGGAAAAPIGQDGKPAERSRAPAGDSVRFDYRVRGADGQSHAVSFALPAEAYAEARQGLKPLQSDAVKGRLDRRVQRYAEDSSASWREGMRARLQALEGTLPDNVQLDYAFAGKELSWSLKGRGVTQADLERHAQRLAQQIRRASARLKQQQRRDFQAYRQDVSAEVLRRFSYIRDPDLGGLIRPDYAALAKRQADLLRPMARAVAEAAGTRNTRRQVALALALMQEIPYDELRTRGATDGTGFAVPAELLHVNQGDCDSKATALASLMRTLAPGTATAIVLLPGHAVLAADLPPQPGDRTLQLDGERFVLMEPAGPARIPLGQISDTSRQLLSEQGIDSLVWITGGPQGA
jgi:transglutaminase-like putative cysteine protease